MPSDFCWFLSFIQRAHPNQRLKALSRMWVKASISQSLWCICINNSYDLHWNADSWLTSKWLNQNLQWPKNLHFTNLSQVIIESISKVTGWRSWLQEPKPVDLKYVINNSLIPKSCFYNGSFLDLVSRNVFFLLSLLIFMSSRCNHYSTECLPMLLAFVTSQKSKALPFSYRLLFKGQKKTNRLILQKQALEFPFITLTLPLKRIFFVKFHKHDREPWDLRFALNKKLFLQL